MAKVQIEIEAFKVGEHTDSEGSTQEWTSGDLATIVNTYNERLANDPGVEAPIVKGHPETDAPAYGWVKSLKLDGDKVIATAELNSEFADEVKDELYKKVSIALYPDLMLRHIGFLGAAQPAVKGLEPVKFNTDQTFKTYQIDNDKQTNFSEFTITMKDTLKREKPVIWKDYAMDDFADPVHFRFPVKTRSEVKASMAIFSRDNVYSQYDDNEQQYIAARLIKAAQTHEINLTPSTWAYVDIPAEHLTKTQLLNLVKQSEQTANNNSFTNNGVQTMDEYLKGLCDYLCQQLATTVNQEVATQCQTWCDDYIAQNPPPAVKDAEDVAEDQAETAAGLPNDGATATGTAHAAPAIPKEYAERMERLERKNRELEFNEYFKSQSGRLVPAQKDLLFSIFESTHNKAFEFAENGKTKVATVQDGLKKFIATLPKQIEFSEQATRERLDKENTSYFNMPDRSIVDEESAQLDKKANMFMEEQHKLGNKITYLQAFQTIIKKS